MGKGGRESQGYLLDLETLGDSFGHGGLNSDCATARRRRNCAGDGGGAEPKRQCGKDNQTYVRLASPVHLPSITRFFLAENSPSVLWFVAGNRVTAPKVI